MTTVPINAYTKVQNVPRGAAFRITSGAYIGHVCLYRTVRTDWAVEVIVRNAEGFHRCSDRESRNDYGPPITVEPSVIELAPDLYNIAASPELFGPPAPLLDREGRPQEGTEGWKVRNPEPGITVWERTPTYYDELEGPPAPPVPLDLPTLARQYNANFRSYNQQERNSETSSDHRATYFPITQKPIQTCMGCSARNRRMRRCSCCKTIQMTVYYCNQACQRSHLKAHRRDKANLLASSWHA